MLELAEVWRLAICKRREERLQPGKDIRVYPSQPSRASPAHLGAITPGYFSTSTIIGRAHQDFEYAGWGNCIQCNSTRDELPEL